MKNLIKTMVFLAVAAWSTEIYAQPDFSAEVKAKMQSLDFMVGDWEGSGWAMTPSGKENTEVKESITYALNGTILQVNGLGTKENKVVHEAFGVITFNPFTKAYGMDAYVAKGMKTAATVEILDEGKIKWYFKAGPNMTIKYMLTVEDGIWTEIGERSMDGENWQQFFEMTLKKT